MYGSHALFSSVLAYASFSLGQILNIVAHQDDDLLFLSPDLLHYIQTGQEVRTVYLTAGDSGQETSYWHGREAGARTAYALMSDSPNTWTEKDAEILGHEAPLFQLEQDPGISLVFLRLPDGNLLGQGFEVTGSGSLQKLREESIPSIRTVSGSGSYTKEELVNSLVYLISDFLLNGDHYSAAYFVTKALELYDGVPTLAGYTGYPVVNKTANVVGADLLGKRSAFFAYGRSDPFVCNSDLACADDAFYPRWLERQHAVEEALIANAGPSQVAGLDAVVTLDGTASLGTNSESLVYEWTQVSGPLVDLTDAETSQPFFITPGDPDTLTFELVVKSEQKGSSPAIVMVTTTQNPENIAFKAKVTASSSNVNADQTPDKAIDGNTGGLPAAHAHEWATEGDKAGSWLSLSWESPQLISRIVLHDRPNLDDQVKGAVVENGGEILEVGELSNYGTARTLDVGDRAAQNLTVRITTVSQSTMNAGFSEIQVFGTSVE
ncbi:uncharacterized protein BDV17DRAFT_279345 [Aspergillus undulatus]|uniref:uncharacterized protein n=1 Tax=Aspergillus undulatus TaxID=1810928 RepID=UPI003CCDB09F